MTQRGRGKAYRWVEAHLDYPHKDFCLIWPFCRDKHGRGILGWNGRNYWAHRLVCELAHGKPPTDEHTAAHTCGKGHDGCVNPHHLAWKTQAENLADCRQHGTLIRHRGGNVRRLLPEQAKAIRDARGFQTQGQLAVKFGVSEGTISDIWHGRIYRDGSKINHWSPEEDARLRRLIGIERMTQQQAANELGRPLLGVGRRARLLGLQSSHRPSHHS